MPYSESSNSPKAAKAAERPSWRIVVTWLCRLIVGTAFIIGGWAKSVDPYGTLYKLLEYFAAWGMHDIPHEPVVMGAVALGALEFTIGACVITGVLRHSSAIAATVVMCFMLPLTAYIAIADPVSDCGCFGDLIILDNTTTFLKNVVLAYACVWLLRRNASCGSPFHASVQWAVVASSVIYALALAAVGYNVQPVADFRPYPLGTSMYADAGDDITLIYEKDGTRREFAVDELPDSTWTYISPAGSAAEDAGPGFPVFGEDGEETDIFEAEGDLLVFVVPDPGELFLTRSRFANDLADYAAIHGATAVAIVGTSTAGLQEWKLLAAPHFEAYTAEDTDLKTLVRGDMGAVYLRDGIIQWKRNLASLDADLTECAPENTNALENISRPDDGRLATAMTLAYLGVLALLALGSFVIGVRRRK